MLVVYSQRQRLETPSHVSQQRVVVYSQQQRLETARSLQATPQMPPPGKQKNEADSRTSHEKRTITKRFQKHEVAVAVHKNTPMNETIIAFAIALATVITKVLC